MYTTLRTGPVALAFMGLALAGCVSAPEEVGPTAGLEADFDDATGAIRGLVLSQEQLPVEGAEASLFVADEETPRATAMTGPDGVFTLNFVPPGEHQVAVGAEGYKAVIRTIAVEAGTVTEETVFELVQVASDAPYHTTTLHPVVVSGLSFTVPRDCIHPTGDPQPKTCQGSRSGCDGQGEDPCEVHYGHCGVEPPDWGWEWGNYGCDFGPEWATIIMELDSVPQTTTTGKGWSITALGPNAERSGCGGNDTDCGSANNDADPRAFRTVAWAPIYQWIDKEILADRDVDEEDWCCDWVWRLYPGPCDIQGCDFPAGNIGFMQEQKATVYWTYFMREGAPEGWSAFQDA